MASSEPLMGIHSSGDLMKASESQLITPSRSRMISFMLWPMAISDCQLGNIGNLIQHQVQIRQQRQPVVAQLFIFRHHHYVVEKGIDFGTQQRQRLQRTCKVALREGGID